MLGRTVRNALCVVAIAIAVVTASIWTAVTLRAPRTFAEWRFHDPAGHACSVLLFHRGVLFRLTHHAVPGKQNVIYREGAPVPYYALDHDLKIGSAMKSEVIGFSISTAEYSTGVPILRGIGLPMGSPERARHEQAYKRSELEIRSFDMVVPFWALLVAALLYPLRRVVLNFRAYFRRRRGACPHCGYDLHACPDRCPECGAPSVAAKPRSAEVSVTIDGRQTCL